MSRLVIIVAAITALTSAGQAQESPAQLALWADLVTNVFDGRPIEDGTGVLSLEAPKRAEDAAIVPITIRSELPAGSPLRLKKITLVIDENPAPVAAAFELGPARTIEAISTRVRVDKYTNIHAVAELSDGKLYSVEKFVKASGGCSAPAAKNPAGASAALGEMRVRWFDAPAEGPDPTVEAQLMIRHPNNSGLQRDLLTNYYIPAHFVRDLTVTAGSDLLFRMEGGISISENPSFRFTYSGNDSEPISAVAIDTDEQTFSGSWPGRSGSAF